MRVNPDAWQNAMRHRGFFTLEYLKYHGPTDSAAGVFLVQAAKGYGYSDRDRAVPGRTLRSWTGGESVPQWAVKTMVRYVLSKGYIPDSNKKLDALLVYLLVDLPHNAIDDALSTTRLLDHLDPKAVEKALGRIWHAKLSVRK